MTISENANSPLHLLIEMPKDVLLNLIGNVTFQGAAVPYALYCPHWLFTDS